MDYNRAYYYEGGEEKLAGFRLQHEDDNNRRLRSGEELPAVPVPGGQVHGQLHHDHRHELYLENRDS